MNQAYFCASFDACLGCVVLVGLELWCVAFVLNFAAHTLLLLASSHNPGSLAWDVDDISLVRRVVLI